jgi:hypothetical protein
MSFLDLFRSKQEDEPSRIARLSKTGRITEGTILDVISDSNGQIAQVCYSYELGGVQYESSQELSRAQQLHANDYIPGTRIVIRYDPRQHANSIVV